MAYTLLDIKKGVATQLGKANYSTANAVRDQRINDARREFYMAKRWTFTKKDESLTFSSGVANWPTDYNPTFDLGQIYSYLGTEKTTFTEVPFEDLAQYSATDGYYYALDFENRQFKSNRQSDAVTLTYHHIPADKALDGTDDSDLEIAPDITPIIFLATAGYWLAAERDDDNYDRFRALYVRELRRQKVKDERVGAERSVPQHLRNYNLGYNV